jgi:hypothetical protein
MGEITFIGDTMLKKLILSTLLLYPVMAKSQILVDLSNLKPSGGLSFGGALGFSEVEYDSDNHTYDVNRKTLGLGIVSNVANNINLVAQFGYTFDAKLDDDWKGKGYMLGGGLDALLYKGARVGFAGYGFLNYIDEEYKLKKNRKVKCSFSDLDFHLGGLFLFQANSNIMLYGGPDLVVYSKGTVTYGKDEVEMERSKNLNFKVGMDIYLNKATLRPELTFIGEKTLVLGVGFSS